MSQSSATRRLRARMALPMFGPVITDAAVVVEGDRLVGVGPWRDVHPHWAGDWEDLGEVVVLPGLINAHAHLDYTLMAGNLPPPREFSDWIKGILALKAAWSYTEYAASWVEGARMLARYGTTTVADIEAVPELLPEAWSSTPLRVISCLELTGIKSGRDPRDLVEEALSRLGTVPPGRSQGGLSPHAPYSTSSRLLHLAAEASRREGLLLTTHVAESQAEFDMYQHAAGPLHDWLSWNGRDMSDCGGRTPVRYLAEAGYLSRELLAVHANYLAEEDRVLLGEHGVTVVHCPRSHDYFGHAPFPYEALVEHGVRVVLGTDSLASVRCSGRESVELDLFAEMRAFAGKHPEVEETAVLAMVTCDAAEGVGMGDRVGRLKPGCLADLAVLELAPTAEEVEPSVVYHEGAVRQLMIGGEWVSGVAQSTGGDLGEGEPKEREA